jgi:NCS1 family nucleobase:cation symporter-1
MSRWRKFLQYIEVPTDFGVPNTPWLNRDLIPMPKERRTYKIWSYFIYWCISGLCISGYAAGSTLLAYGLDARQAIVSLVIGGLIIGVLCVACGWMGERWGCDGFYRNADNFRRHHIGFTVACRFSWGMR